MTIVVRQGEGGISRQIRLYRKTKFTSAWMFLKLRHKSSPLSMCKLKIENTAVADLGFPRGGGANFQGGRHYTISPKFPQNCMKLKEFGPPGGARVQNFTM